MKFYTIIALLCTASAIRLGNLEDPKPAAMKDASPLPKKEGAKKAKEEEVDPPLPNMGNA